MTSSTYNEPSLSIDLSNGDVDLASIQEAIRSSASTADSVEVVCSFFEFRQSQALLPASFSHIIPIFIEMGRTLTKLKSISITVNHAKYDGFGRRAPFPIYALKHLLQLRANSLVSIKFLWKVLLVGSPSEFEDTYEVLSESKILKAFTMECVEVMKYETDGMGAPRSYILPLHKVSAWVEDSLIEALSDIDSLQELVLSDVTVVTSLCLRIEPLVRLCRRPSDSTKELMMVDLSNMYMPNQMFGILCSNRRIAKLRLTDIKNIDDGEISEIGLSLRENRFMKELQIKNSNEDGGLGPEQALYLLGMLEENETLELLDIDLSFDEDDDDDPEYGERWTNAVKNIGHLKRLNLQLYLNRDYSKIVDTVSLLLDGLKENQMLTHLELNLCDGSDNQSNDNPSSPTEVSQGGSRIIAKLENALQTNKVLQHIKITRNDSEEVVLSKNVGFWLMLNRCGRQYLEAHLDDRTSWVDTIIHHKNDPPVAFHLLITNPNICQVAGSLVPQNRKRGIWAVAQSLWKNFFGKAP